jgi:hypothetical protein
VALPIGDAGAVEVIRIGRDKADAARVEHAEGIDDG